MQIDLRTVSIKPLRNTYDHVAERLGGDKAASRYQEGTLDLQANANFHYRPYWDPTHEIHDVTRTSIVMKDWYAFKDPRQMYYGVYTITRARQQEAAEANYAMIEERNLAASMSEEVKRTALAVLDAAAPRGLGRQHEQRVHLRLWLRHWVHAAVRSTTAWTSSAWPSTSPGSA
jgi:phenol hydroxylase P1 protein